MKTSRIPLLVSLALLLLAPPGAWAGPDLAAEAQAAARQGAWDGRRDGAREGDERGRSDGFPFGRREGFESAAYRLGQESGDREGAAKGEREATDLGSRKGREEGERDGSRDGAADGERKADGDATAPGRAQGTDEAERSDARLRGTRDGIAQGAQDALAQARKVDEARGHTQYRTERWHLPPRTRKRLNVPRSGALDPGWLASTTLLAWGEESRVPEPDRRYHCATAPYSEPHRFSAYLDAYRPAYVSGFREAYRGAFASARNRGYDEGASAARSQNPTSSSAWRRGYEEASAQAYRRTYDQTFPRVFERVKRDVFDETFARTSRETYASAYPAALERHRQSAYEARWNALYGEAFKSAHDTRFAALYPGLARQYYARGRAAEMRAFKERPVRIAYVAVHDDGDGIIQPGETVRLDVVLRNFGGTRVPAEKLSLSVLPRPFDSLSGAERRVGLPQGLGPGEELELTDLVRLQASPSAVGKPCLLGFQLRVNGRDMDALTQDLTVKWPLAVNLEAVPMAEGVPATWRLGLENQGKAPITAVQVRLSPSSDQVELPATLSSTVDLPEGKQASLPIEVTAWRMRDTESATTMKVEITGAGRLLASAQLPCPLVVASPCTVAYLGGKMRLREPGDCTVEFRVSGPTGDGAGPLGTEASVAPDLVGKIEPLGVDMFPDGRCVVRMRVRERNNGGVFYLGVRRGDTLVMRRRIEF